MPEDGCWSPSGTVFKEGVEQYCHNPHSSFWLHDWTLGHLRFCEVLLKPEVLRDVISCPPVDSYKHFELLKCFHLQGQAVLGERRLVALFDPEGKGTTIYICYLSNINAVKIASNTLVNIKIICWISLNVIHRMVSTVVLPLHCILRLSGQALLARSERLQVVSLSRTNLISGCFSAGSHDRLFACNLESIT